MGKMAVFPGGYGRIGELPHWQLRPDWGLYGSMSSTVGVLSVTVGFLTV